MEVTVSNLGGIITNIRVPDRDGKVADVVLAGDTVETLVNNPPYLGAMIGRTAGRTEKGQFTVDGSTYNVTVNNGPNNLHGGKTGLHAADFTMSAFGEWQRGSGAGTFLELSYTSPDGEDGYPGDLLTTCRFELRDDRNALAIKTTASSNKACPVNITNHSYFNLNGHDANAPILGHEVQINASKYVQTDADMVATGTLLDTKGSAACDFSTAKKISADIGAFKGDKALGEGYDHCFVIDNDMAEKNEKIKSAEEGVRLAATCTAPESGRVMRVYTDLSCVHLYTGNWLDDSVAFKQDTRYTKYGGLCFECQHPANSQVLNGKPGADPVFRDIIVRPGKPYAGTIVFEFDVAGGVATSRL